ncbi:MAG: macrodomain Ter protein organizer (MatP/YcbG family) [Candidatus Woesearchaeota archaeon]
MAIKSFNIDQQTYTKFSTHCKENGISMSKQVEFFMKTMIEEPEISEEYAKKLENIRKGPFKTIKGSFADNF